MLVKHIYVFFKYMSLLVVFVIFGWFPEPFNAATSNGFSQVAITHIPTHTQSPERRSEVLLLVL